MIVRLVLVFIIVFVVVFLLTGVIGAGQKRVHDVVINKISTNNLDWIELYNRSDETIDVSGFVISDGRNFYKLPELPDPTKIESKGVIIIGRSKHQEKLDAAGIHADLFWGEGWKDNNEKDWGFDDRGEFVILLSKHSEYVVDLILSVRLEEGEIQERCPNGSSDWYKTGDKGQELIQVTASGGSVESIVPIEPMVMVMGFLNMLKSFITEISTLLASVVTGFYALEQLKKHIRNLGRRKDDSDDQPTEQTKPDEPTVAQA